MRRIALSFATGSWLVAVVASGAASPPQAEYAWILPRGFPTPPVPADNPMSEAKVQLGRHLFYDARLSGNRTQSCASCHLQSRAFTDGRSRSIGSTGQQHPRGSMSLVNVAYASVFNWANPSVTRLEDQALVPMYGDQPIELGLDRADVWLRALERDQTYRRLFREACPGLDQAFTSANVTKAIASFERAIVSARSPYDRYHFDRDDAAIRGFDITPAQKADLVEFLRTLTDQALIQDSRLANPWRRHP